MTFWREKSLDELSESEWESLCDGCGRCCTVKLEDEDSGEIVDTNYACRLLDCASCRCTDYERRFDEVPGCMDITVEKLADPQFRGWLPVTCAYRLLAEGYELADWHPLVSGTTDSVITAGISLRGMLVPEPEDL